MYIADKRQKQTRNFVDLNAGQPFYYPEEGWYGMKLAVETEAGDNAVDIETGELAQLTRLDQVIEIRGQFEIL